MQDLGKVTVTLVTNIHHAGQPIDSVKVIAEGRMYREDNCLLLDYLEKNDGQQARVLFKYDPAGEVTIRRNNHFKNTLVFSQTGPKKMIYATVAGDMMFTTGVKDLTSDIDWDTRSGRLTMAYTLDAQEEPLGDYTAELLFAP